MLRISGKALKNCAFSIILGCDLHLKKTAMSERIDMAALKKDGYDSVF